MSNLSIAHYFHVLRKQNKKPQLAIEYKHWNKTTELKSRLYNPRELFLPTFTRLVGSSSILETAWNPYAGPN